MLLNETSIKGYVVRGCALVDGCPLDYITVNVPSQGFRQRSYIEHAHVKCGEHKSVTAVVDEVWGHVESIVDAGNEEKAHKISVMLRLYRMKTPAGCATFVTDPGPIVEPDELEQEPAEPKGMAAALVAGMAVLQRSQADLVGALRASSSKGWEVAGDLLKQNIQLSGERGELMALNAMGNQEAKGTDPVTQLTIAAATEFMSFIKEKALRAEQAKPAEPVTTEIAKVEP